MKNISFIGEKIKANANSLLSIIIVFSLILIVSISVMVAADNFFDTTPVAAYTKLNQISSNLTNPIDIQNVPAKKFMLEILILHTRY
jgi:hypothetical protein